MAFNYSKHKNSGDGHGSVWTSYSDLFLGLSVIFLLLYVTASLRQGTNGFQTQRLALENTDLKKQLQAYQAMTDDYLKKKATEQEADNYQELMDQLDLLQDKADEEKRELRKQAQEHEKKERALNKYQQMIRNIINANMVSKAGIKKRDVEIESQDQQIASNEEEIQTLEQSVAEKKAQLTLNDRKIKDLNANLDTRMKQLRSSYKLQKISQSKFEQQKKAIEAETQRKVAALRAQNQTVSQQLNEVNEQLNQTNAQLAQTEQKAAQLGQKADQLGQDVNRLGQEKMALKGQFENEKAAMKGDFENEKSALKGQFENEKLALKGKYDQDKAYLQGKLAQERAAFEGQKAKLQGDYDTQRARDKAAFDAALAKEKLTGAQRAAREAAFKADADRKARALGDQLSHLQGKMRDTEGALAKAQENLNAKKKITEQIKRNFASAGVKADVDEATGDVILSFGNQYFDTDRSDLKPGMVNIIRQAMPQYSKSLFEDPKIANKIQNVEIVGFASPTYQGKYIDPKSLDPADRQAINYNLDLSYARAKSIFNVVFDQKKMTFEHQRKLLPLVKVTGRSFFSNPDDQRGVASDSSKSFCEKNDCAKLQRVIIKFNLKD